MNEGLIPMDGWMYTCMDECIWIWSHCEGKFKQYWMKPIWMKRCLTWMKSLFDDNGKKFELYEFLKHMDYNMWHMDGWNWKTLLLINNWWEWWNLGELNGIWMKHKITLMIHIWNHYVPCAWNSPSGWIDNNINELH